MYRAAQASTHQSSPARGAWKLAARKALSLRPREACVLTVVRGRAWVTAGGATGLAPDDSGDHVLAAGQRLLVPGGSHVVVEAWKDEDTFFDWQPQAALVWAPAAAPAAVTPREAVWQPLVDLRQAGGLAARSMGRLGAGLVRLGWARLAGRHNAAAPIAAPWLAPSPSCTTSSATKSWT